MTFLGDPDPQFVLDGEHTQTWHLFGKQNNPYYSC